ncbi:hypothetical protein BS78_09G130900 [Paspalum vaginatum]|nr:hypothetical protein BS78_09G130900 [Paspalum vaginatum]
MCKRPHETAVYPDVASASASQQGDAKRPRPSSADGAGALVIYDNVQPADVEPAMNDAAAPNATAPPQLPRAPANREEPPCSSSSVRSLPIPTTPRRARPSTDAGSEVPYDADVQPVNAVPAAGPVVPYHHVAEPADAEPINAVPLNAIAPLQQPRPAPPPAQDREEPPCLRTRILPALRLRADLPACFLGEKRVTDTDLNRQQNRFRIPTDGLRYLRAILTPEELQAANLLHDPAPRPRKTTRREPEPQPGNEAQQGEQQQQQARRKKAGKVHGGYAVRLVDLAAGASGVLLLSRWDSSGGTVVKGEGYMEFIRRCSFKVNDVVEIWAFKQRRCPFPIFKTIMCDESVLYFLLVKKGADCRSAATAIAHTRSEPQIGDGDGDVARVIRYY